MVIENANISKNEDGTFMMRVFIDNGYEKVEVIIDKVIFDDFILKQEEVIVKPQKVEVIGTKDCVKEFHVNLKGIALHEVDDKSGSVGRIIRHPKETIE